MAGKSELKSKYKDLIRKGKIKEAQKILSQIREMITKSPKREIEKTVKPISKKRESLDNLSDVRGIGKETVEDIKKIYDSIGALKSALEEDKVPLRNDIVTKLKKHLF